MAIQLFETRQILLKKEVTPGTDPTPTGAANALLSFSGTVAIEADKLERNPDRPYFGASPFLLVGKRASVEFELELLGSSTVGNASPIGPVFQTCGFAEVLTGGISAAYNPVSSNFTTATIYFYIGSLRCTMSYAIGNMEFMTDIKGFNRVKCKYTGIITNSTTPTEASVGAVTLTAFQNPPAVEMENYTVVVGGVHLNCKKFDVNMNADIKIHEASELRAVGYMQRKPGGNFTVLEPSLGSFNPWSLANAYTYQNTVATIGTSAGKICTITMPQLQIEYPKITNVDGAVVFDIPFNALPTSGNDEISVVFT